jgi:hypothetical protein
VLAAFIIITLMMEAASTSETVNFYQTTSATTKKTVIFRHIFVNLAKQKQWNGVLLLPPTFHPFFLLEIISMFDVT